MNKPNWPKITAETPIEEVQRIHKDIWQYVVENGEKPETPYFADCAACEYAVHSMRKSEGKTILYCQYCRYCPIEWPNGAFCSGLASLYNLWSDAPRGSQQKLDLAIEMRDIPFKGGSEDV